jgi:hypothetical protein
MKQIIFTDSHGLKRKVLVKDEDGEEQAPYGIPVGPPDMRRIDWEGVARTINNTLAEMGVFTWQDWQRNPQAINASTNVVKRALITIFREEYEITRAKE